MTTNDIDAIRKLTDAATPGPWGVGNDTFVASELERLPKGVIQYRYAVAELDEYTREESDEPNPVPAAADAEFIAAARTLVPALCDEVEQLRAYTETTRHHQQKHAEAVREVEQLRAELDRVRLGSVELISRVHYAEQQRAATAAELKKVRAELAANERSEDARLAIAKAELTRLRAELEKVRAVVDAAAEWRAQFSKPANTKLPRMAALIAAVDALPDSKQHSDLCPGCSQDETTETGADQ